MTRCLWGTPVLGVRTLPPGEWEYPYPRGFASHLFGQHLQVAERRSSASYFVPTQAPLAIPARIYLLTFEYNAALVLAERKQSEATISTVLDQLLPGCLSIGSCNPAQYKLQRSPGLMHGVSYLIHSYYADATGGTFGRTLDFWS